MLDFSKKLFKKFLHIIKKKKKKSIDDENNDIDDYFLYLEFDADP